MTQPSSSVEPPVRNLAGVLHTRFIELLGQLLVRHHDGREVTAFFARLLEHAADAILRDGDLLDLALAHEGLEIAVGDRLARLEGKDEGVGQRQQEKKSERVPHGGGRPGTRREPPVTRFFAARGRSLR